MKSKLAIPLVLTFVLSIMVIAPVFAKAVTIGYEENSEHTIEDFDDVSDWSLKSKGGVASGQFGFSSGANLWIVCNDAGNEYASFKRDVSIDPNTYPSLAINFHTSSNTMFKVNVKDSAGMVKPILSVSNQLAWTTSTVNLKSYTKKMIAEMWLTVDDDPDTTASGEAHVFIRSIIVSGYGWKQEFCKVCVSYWRLGSAYGTSSYGLSSDGKVAKLWLEADDGGDEEYAGYRKTVSIDPNTYPNLSLRFRTTPNALLEIKIKDSAGKVLVVLSTSSQTWAIQKIDLKGFTTRTITEIQLYVNDEPDSTATGQTNAIIDYIQASS